MGSCVLSGMRARDLTSWCSWIHIKRRVFLFSAFEAVVSVGALKNQFCFLGACDVEYISIQIASWVGFFQRSLGTKRGVKQLPCDERDLALRVNVLIIK